MSRPADAILAVLHRAMGYQFSFDAVPSYVNRIQPNNKLIFQRFERLCLERLDNDEIKKAVSSVAAIGAEAVNRFSLSTKIDKATEDDAIRIILALDEKIVIDDSPDSVIRILFQDYLNSESAFLRLHLSIVEDERRLPLYGQSYVLLSKFAPQSTKNRLIAKNDVVKFVSLADCSMDGKLAKRRISTIFKMSDSKLEALKIVSDSARGELASYPNAALWIKDACSGDESAEAEFLRLFPNAASPFSVDAPPICSISIKAEALCVAYGVSGGAASRIAAKIVKDVGNAFQKTAYPEGFGTPIVIDSPESHAIVLKRHSDVPMLQSSISEFLASSLDSIVGGILAIDPVAKFSPKNAEAVRGNIEKLVELWNVKKRLSAAPTDDKIKRNTRKI